ncbi:hypothetical protein PR202_ga27084 [Eleusine coracana subsp. coracana]|uniref:Uncharacterized protein n=1 Tax=Eleusine coracana subsp. coracana TaxID=191504 RepID=A0AAV5DFI9_ELECO|nr:hypothetical protein PR202_ga27084 [Eleusine coracana subsp. coracana]
MPDWWRRGAVLEHRTALINRLEHSFSYSADDLRPVLDSVIVSWDDTGCSGISHFMLHKSVLQVALKRSHIDITDYLGQFLTLGAKQFKQNLLLVYLYQASLWCRKHLLWSVESIDESEDAQEEEHSRLFPCSMPEQVAEEEDGDAGPGAERERPREEQGEPWRRLLPL